MAFILDETNFLAASEFQEILDRCPPDTEWKSANVYDRRAEKNVVNGEFRHAQKVHERSLPDCKRWQSACTRRLVGLLRRSLPHFHYLFARPARVEWLRYEPGMFFKPHQDFERYTCNGMIPYVLLIGLRDVEKGGETRVGERVCTGSTRANGAVFFPSNMIHEACPVEAGIKCCLKLEYFVFVDEDPITISSETAGWTSYWTRSALSMTHNYIRSHLDFSREAETRLFLSESTAQGFVRLMKDIASPHPSYPTTPFQDMMFPGLTIPVLHDLFITLSPDPIVLGRQPMAWDHLHRHPLSSICLTGLWVREARQSKYTLWMVVDRMGRPFRKISGRKEISIGPSMVDEEEEKSGTRFLPYPYLRERLIQQFIAEKDMPSTKTSDRHGTSDPQVAGGEDYPEDVLRTHLEHYWPDLRKIQPSDDAHDESKRIAGTILREEREFCNDEDAGYEIVRWTEYKSYKIQTRWIRLSLTIN